MSPSWSFGKGVKGGRPFSKGFPLFVFLLVFWERQVVIVQTIVGVFLLGFAFFFPFMRGAVDVLAGVGGDESSSLGNGVSGNRPYEICVVGLFPET